MKEGGKYFTDNTANNCGFNCFMGSRQKMKASQSESFWPKFRRRIKHDGKSMAEYAVKISPAGNKTGKSESFVLSVSRGRDVIPVKIVSPVGKEENIQKFAVNKRTKERKAGRRSWVRIVVGAFRFSTKQSLNGKVIQDPPQERDSEIVAVQSVPPDSNQRPVEKSSEALNSDPRDSVPRPVEKSSEARNCITVFNRKSRVQSHVSAPCSPVKGSLASSSYSNLPRDDVALLRHTPPRSIKVHRLASTVFDSEVALQNCKIQRWDARLGFSVLIIVLFCLAVSDKFFAIVCTSIWWYAVPKLRTIGKSEEAQKIPEAKKLLTKSLSNNNIDLHSSEYRKKVIMEGILHRNHRLT